MCLLQTSKNFSPFEISFTRRAKNQKNFLKKNVDFRAVSFRNLGAIGFTGVKYIFPKVTSGFFSIEKSNLRFFLCSIELKKMGYT
jgi:hypothetical protein